MSAQKIRKTGPKKTKVVLVSGLVMGLINGGQLVHAQFSLGDSANYAVLFEGGGANALDVSGPDAISGNLGIGNPNGGTVTTAGVNLSGNLTLTGTVDLNLAAQQYAASGNGAYQNSATYSGGSIDSVTGVGQVQTDLNNLNTLSSTLGVESGTSLSVNINNNQSQTINASAGDIQSGNSVFKVSSWNFGGGSTLTINGNGLGDSVVINFADSIINNPSFGGTILLTGGLTANQVLFNFTGGSDLTGGPTLMISANGATEAGTFLDPNGDMSIDNSVLDGHFFGGDSHNDQVVSGATIIATVPEPGSVTLTLLGGFLGIIVWKQRRAPVRNAKV
jgi:hypothetical protein